MKRYGVERSTLDRLIKQGHFRSKQTFIQKKIPFNAIRHKSHSVINMKVRVLHADDVKAYFEVDKH